MITSIVSVDFYLFLAMFERRGVYSLFWGASYLGMQGIWMHTGMIGICHYFAID